jgi:hypothetical protein
MTALPDLDAREALAMGLVEDAMPDVIACPDLTCGAPVRIIDRWSWASSDGLVEHIKTTCERGHWFTPAIDSLHLTQAQP